MPHIRGFCAWRYNEKMVRDLSKVFAPPYDVISRKAQKRYHRLHPYNVIRLILGVGTKSQPNWYASAKDYLKRWKSKHILVQESRPAIYIYVQEYREEKKWSEKKRRIGFMAAMALASSSVLKHENTLAAPKKDRLALLKKVETNLSPIFGLYEDPGNDIGPLLIQSTKARPAIDVYCEGVRHQIFIENRPDRVNAICRKMAKKPMFIADGHHRFEVACQFQALKQRGDRSRCSEAPWNYVMTYFSDCLHNPFTIYPTHRLLCCPNKESPASILSQLNALGSLRPVKNLSLVLQMLKNTRPPNGPKSNQYFFGVYSKKEGFYLLSLSLRAVQSIGKSPIEKLDVSVLHRTIVEPYFGIKVIAKSASIDFTRDPKAACHEVETGVFDMAFFLRPTSLAEMIEVSKRGLKMPQKSTYFYPKLLSGLVFHSLKEGSQ